MREAELTDGDLVVVMFVRRHVVERVQIIGKTLAAAAAAYLTAHPKLLFLGINRLGAQLATTIFLIQRLSLHMAISKLRYPARKAE